MGQWQDNVPCGQGTLFKLNGNKYVGEWEDGKPCGQGTIYSSDGFIIQKGEWKEGMFYYQGV